MAWCGYKNTAFMPFSLSVLLCGFSVVTTIIVTHCRCVGCWTSENPAKYTLTYSVIMCLLLKYAPNINICERYTLTQNTHLLCVSFSFDSTDQSSVGTVV